MSLRKSKCWYSNNCLHLFKARCSITTLYLCLLATGGSTVVEHLAYNVEIKGSYPAGTGGAKNVIVLITAYFLA